MQQVEIYRKQQRFRETDPPDLDDVEESLKDLRQRMLEEQDPNSQARLIQLESLGDNIEHMRVHTCHQLGCLERASMPQGADERRLAQHLRTVQTLQAQYELLAGISTEPPCAEAGQSGTESVLRLGVKRTAKAGTSHHSLDVLPLPLKKQALKHLGRSSFDAMDYESPQLFDGLFLCRTGRDRSRRVFGEYYLFQTAAVEKPILISIDLTKNSGRVGGKRPIEDLYDTIDFQIEAVDFWNASNPLLSARLSVDGYNNATDEERLWNDSAQYGWTPAGIGHALLRENPDFPNPNNYDRPWTLLFLGKMYGGKDFLHVFRNYGQGTDPAFSARLDLHRLIISGDLERMQRTLKERDDSLGCLEFRSTSSASIIVPFSGKSRG